MKQPVGRSRWLGLLAIGLLASSPVAGEALLAENVANVDFAGAWEMDYRSSDDINRKLQALFRDIQRAAERRAQLSADRRAGPGLVIGDASSDSIPSIVGLARMAELVTRSQVLEIAQSRTDIRVSREDDFALTCDFHGGAAVVEENPLGREVCGWDEHQLVFQLFLPEGLTIQHRLTLGPEGARLNVATTVLSDRVSQPFTLNRVYNRFQPGSSGIRCETTITRGKVCTTVSS
jgi:hypothetical protein